MATPLHKPPTSAGKLTRLLMAITLAIIAALPASAQDAPDEKPNPQVLQDSIVLMRYTERGATLEDLIKNNIVTGIPTDENGDYLNDYTIESSNNGVVKVSDKVFWGGSELGTATMTFHHKTYPEISFALKVTTKTSPCDVIRMKLGEIYEGYTKSVTVDVTDNMIPLSEFTVTLQNGTFYTGESDCRIDGNTFTVTGVSEGTVNFEFYRLGSKFVQTSVVKKPSPSDVTVKEDIVLPAGFGFNLQTLIKAGVVSGLSENVWADYKPSSSNTELVKINESNQQWINIIGERGTAVLTFTHKDFGDDMKFDVTIEVRPSPARYIEQTIGEFYVNEPKTFIIPADYMPLSHYKSIEARSIWNISEPAEIEVNIDIDPENNTLILRAAEEGYFHVVFIDEYGMSGYAWVNAISRAQIGVPTEHVVIPSGFRSSLENLIRAGIVTGIDANDAQNFEMVSTDEDVIYTVSFEGIMGAQVDAMGKSATVTFKHREIDGLQFDITFDVKGSCYGSPVYSVFTWSRPAVVDLNGEIPGEDYTVHCDDVYNQFATCEVIDGKLTVTGKKAGKAYYKIYYKDYAYHSRVITVSEDKIVVNREVEISVNYSLNLSRLASATVIEGLPVAGRSEDYIATTSDSNVMSVSGTTSSASACGLGRAAVTYTHKACHDVSFTVDVVVKKSPMEAFRGLYYLNVPRTIVVGPEYCSLSNYTIEYNQDMIDLEVNGDTIIITGKHVSEPGYNASFGLRAKAIGGYHGTSLQIVEVPVDTPEVIDGEGIAQTDAEVPVKIELPEEVKQEQEKLGADVEFEWVADNEEIATVDENGVVIPNKLGCTTITYRVKQTSTSQKPAFRSRSGKDGVLMTLEFWVTKVVIEGPEKLKAGVPAQLSFRVDAGDDEYPYEVKDIEWTAYNGAKLISTDGPTATVEPMSGYGDALIYLTTSIGTANTRIAVVDDDDPITTGIGAVEAEEGFQPVYDLNGRLVARTPEQKASLASGIYIQGGKKIYLRR